MKKYFLPLGVLGIFMTIAVTLWLTQDNIFYLFNFSYIGISIFFGIFLYIKKYKYARRVAQLLVGLYMLVYLGFICGENMQIEGFWYYLFTGVLLMKILTKNHLNQRMGWCCSHPILKYHNFHILKILILPLFYLYLLYQ